MGAIPLGDLVHFAVNSNGLVLVLILLPVHLRLRYAWRSVDFLISDYIKVEMRSSKWEQIDTSSLLHYTVDRRFLQ